MTRRLRRSKRLVDAEARASALNPRPTQKDCCEYLRSNWPLRPPARRQATGQPLMSDDHSAAEPPLPIPNRTVKRRSADDSEPALVKVGHRQALTAAKKPPPGVAFLFARPLQRPRPDALLQSPPGALRRVHCREPHERTRGDGLALTHRHEARLERRYIIWTGARSRRRHRKLCVMAEQAVAILPSASCEKWTRFFTPTMRSL